MVVHTAPHFFESRDGVRRSWASRGAQEELDMRVVFLVGLPSAERTQRRIEEEAEGFGDILQGEFTDHYNNLTLKSVYTLKYMVQTEWHTVRLPQKVLKKKPF